MEKNKLYRLAYYANLIAAFIFIMSLFFNSIEVETMTYQTTSSYTVTTEVFPLLESLSEPITIGLTPISMIVVVIGLVVTGAVIGYKKKLLGHTFISAAIVFSFAIVNIQYLAYENTKYEMESKVSMNQPVTSYENSIDVSVKLGYLLCLAALIVLVVATFLFISANMMDENKKEVIEETFPTDFDKIVELEALLETEAITREQFNEEIKKLLK